MFVGDNSFYYFQILATGTGDVDVGGKRRWGCGERRTGVRTGHVVGRKERERETKILHGTLRRTGEWRNEKKEGQSLNKWSGNVSLFFFPPFFVCVWCCSSLEYA